MYDDKICLKCGNDKFDIKKGAFTPEIKGMSLNVEAEAYFCKRCGYSLMDTDQMNKFMKSSWNEFLSANEKLMEQFNQIISFEKKMLNQ
jgi:predicted nucleic-acid-binding Zn-ribbon protein